MSRATELEGNFGLEFAHVDSDSGQYLLPVIRARTLDNIITALNEHSNRVCSSIDVDYPHGFAIRRNIGR